MIIREAGFSGGSDGKESACGVGDLGSTLCSGAWKVPLEEDMAIHSSILAWRTPIDRRAWQAIVHGVQIVLRVRHN